MAGASPASRRRDEALAFIINRLVKTGTSPSYEEIGLAMQPRVSKRRAQELVTQLIAEGVIEKTPGAQRALRVRDVTRARGIVDEFARSLGWVVAAPLGALQQPFPQGPLPMLPPFRHPPDANDRGSP
jgi:SOS-response transcriptional repressor LexA